MMLPDVNVLIYAHVEDSTPDHAAYADWLTRLATGPEPFALSVLVLSDFLRVVTNPRVFDPPSTLDQSFAFLSSLLERPTARIVGPGLTTWTYSKGCAASRGPPGSWSPTLNTQRLPSSMDAPWCPPTPTSADSQDCDGSIHCGLPSCNAVPHRHQRFQDWALRLHRLRMRGTPRAL